MPITIFTTKDCAYCPMVKKFLKLKGVEYEEWDVTDDGNMREVLRTNTGYSTVPVTTDGEGTWIVGWKPGELAKLIAKQKEK